MFVAADKLPVLAKALAKVGRGRAWRLSVVGAAVGQASSNGSVVV